jgi:hypothetical protein
VLDPSVAGISATGLVTAIRGGDTQVRAQDALGALDLTTLLHVDDFAVTLATVQAPPGATVRVPLIADRTLGALDIRSLQYSIQWTGTAITSAHATHSGLAGIWSPTGVVTLITTPRINIAGAGAQPLDDSGTEVHAVEFTLSPSATPGTNIPLTVTGLLFNEGAPRARLTSGAIQVRTTAGTDSPPMVLSLAPCEPNPMRANGSIRLTLPRAAHLQLAIYALDGRRVRQLHDGTLPAGAHEMHWDGRDDSARTLAAGLYFCRLETGGQALTRKLALTP